MQYCDCDESHEGQARHALGNHNGGMAHWAVRSVFPEKKNLTEIQRKSRRRDLEVGMERGPYFYISKGQ